MISRTLKSVRSTGGTPIDHFLSVLVLGLVASGCDGNDATVLLLSNQPTPSGDDQESVPLGRATSSEPLVTLPAEDDDFESTRETIGSGAEASATCGGAGEACCTSEGSVSCHQGLGCDFDRLCQTCASFKILDLLPAYEYAAVRGVAASGRFAVGRAGGEGVSDRAVLWDLSTGEVSGMGAFSGGDWSIAHAISLDGTTVLGMGNGSDGTTGIALWKEGSAPEWLGFGEGFAINANGTAATGQAILSGASLEAFRWDASDGLHRLTGAPTGQWPVRGYAINGDGSVIAGDLAIPGVGEHAMRWTREGGIVDLGALPTGTTSNAGAINEAGDIVYGASSSAKGAWVFRWTEAEGLTGIVPIRDEFESAPATNAAGTVVVGRSYSRPFRWEASTGQYQLIRDLLGSVVPQEWVLLSATGVSADGQVIVGTAAEANPGTLVRAWSAQLGPSCEVLTEAPSAQQSEAPLGDEQNRVEPILECDVDSTQSAQCATGQGCERGVCVPCGQFRPIGVYPGHTESVPMGLSSSGLFVVGTGRTGQDGPAQDLRWDLSAGTIERVSGLEQSRAIGVSKDGRVVVGFYEATDSRNNAFLWSESQGLQILAESAQAFKVTPDGQTVVGVTIEPSGLPNGFRWTEAGGFEFLNSANGLVASVATIISSNGQVLAGVGSASLGPLEPTLWTPEGMTLLGDSGEIVGGKASSLSADGTVVVGSMGSGWTEVYRWTEETGMVSIATGSPNDGWPISTDASGELVVGASMSRAFVWEKGWGDAMPLSQRLGELVPPGWVLYNTTDLSQNGRVIVGRGRSPEREEEGWIAVLGPVCATNAF